MTTLDTYRPAHQIALVRPGPASLRWLQEAVRACQAGDPLAPVTVVVPSPYVGLHVRRALAEVGCANVRLVVQLRQVAERLARAGGVPGTDRPLTGPLEGAAIRVAVRQAGGTALTSLADHRSLQDALGAFFRELRHREDPGLVLPTLAGTGAVGSGATDAFQRYEALTAAYPDVPQLSQLAAQVAGRAEGRPRWADDMGVLIVYLPPRLDESELRLLGQLGRHLQIVAAFACCGELQADQLMQETAESLAKTLRTVTRVHEASGTPAEVFLLSAPDPDEETRAMVRRVAADLESGVPLWRMALLYTDEETYGPLAREELGAAGVPWHSALGRPASTGWAARSL